MCAKLAIIGIIIGCFLTTSTKIIAMFLSSMDRFEDFRYFGSSLMDCCGHYWKKYWLVFHLELFFILLFAFISYVFVGFFDVCRLRWTYFVKHLNDHWFVIFHQHLIVFIRRGWTVELDYFSWNFLNLPIAIFIIAPLGVLFAFCRAVPASSR